MVDYSDYDSCDIFDSLAEYIGDERETIEEIEKALPEGMLVRALEIVSDKYGIDLR